MDETRHFPSVSSAALPGDAPSRRTLVRPLAESSPHRERLMIVEVYTQGRPAASFEPQAERRVGELLRESNPHGRIKGSQLMSDRPTSVADRGPLGISRPPGGHLPRSPRQTRSPKTCVDSTTFRATMRETGIGPVTAGPPPWSDPERAGDEPMASIFKRTRDRQRQGRSWYIAYADENGIRRTVKGCPDKAATEAMARKLESEAELRRRGVIDLKADAYRDHDAGPCPSTCPTGARSWSGRATPRPMPTCPAGESPGSWRWSAAPGWKRSLPPPPVRLAMCGRWLIRPSPSTWTPLGWPT